MTTPEPGTNVTTHGSGPSDAASPVAAVTRRIRIEAAPERVFPFLVEADRMARWMGTNVELDPRPGGVFRSDTNGRHVIAGEFLEVEPPRRVLFTFGWEDPDELVGPGQSTVEIVLEPDGNATILTLQHRDLPNDDERTGHGQGWDHFLPLLVDAVSAVDASQPVARD
jgi:uncharacterized protein YndB with AHSA1/START domain